MNEQFINDLSKELAKLGTIHSVGEEWISYTGKIPSGGIPYCGQEVTRETYSALWSWVQAQGLVKTESEWQSIASSQNGNVPFYSSGNGTTTFRMPKLVGYVKGASSQSESGSYVAEGLPNIEGALSPVQSNGTATANWITKTGAFSSSETGTSSAGSSGSTYAYRSVHFDASRSNPIYGNSSHVTPETSVVLFGVYAFGTVVNVGELDARALLDELNTKLPLSGGNVTGNLTVQSKNVVRSVNGASADANGNVTITVPTGTVSQKHKSTFSLTAGATATKTATELVANKPIYVFVARGATTDWCKPPYISKVTNVVAGSTLGSRGVTASSTKDADFLDYQFIPTGTSVAITVYAEQSLSVTLYVYQ